MTLCAVALPPAPDPVTCRLPQPTRRPRRTGNAQAIWEIMSKPADWCLLVLPRHAYRLTETEFANLRLFPGSCDNLHLIWGWGNLLKVSMHTDQTCAPMFAADGRAIRLAIPRDNIEYRFRNRLHVRQMLIARPEHTSAVTVVRFRTATNPETLTIARAILD